jgi:hypothetical protein
MTSVMKQSVSRTGQEHFNERGFTLLSTFLVGLLLLLIAMTLFSRSQSGLAMVYSQQLSARSLSLADAAAVTYQSFVLKYPAVATYNKDSWATFSITPKDCASTIDLTANDYTQIASASATYWQDVVAGDPSQGQFRLVDYRYQPDDISNPAKANVAPGTATLTLEGQVSKINTLVSAMIRPAIARVEIQFRVESHAAQELPIGLWAQDFSVTGSPGSLQANVCDGGGADERAELEPYLGTLPNGQAARVGYSAQTPPTLPSEGTAPFSAGPGVYSISGIQLSNNEICQLPMLNQSMTTTGYPEKCPILLAETPLIDSFGRSVYKYNIFQEVNIEDAGDPNGLDDDAQLILGRTGDETIILYVADQITLEKARIKVIPGTKVILYLQASIKANEPPPQGAFDNAGSVENLQIYMYGSSGTLDLDEGNSTSTAFIYAPDAEVKLNNAKVEGAIWANKWSSEGSAELKQNVVDPNALKVEVPGSNRINPASSWQQRGSA